MKAGVLRDYGATPEFADFEEPRVGEGQVVVEVAAAALHHVDLHKASGTFYMGPPQLPSVVGTDGVGRLADGRRVYFGGTIPPFGSMAEQALAPESLLFDVAESLDDATAAALGNTGLAAWLALDWRSGLKPGECVLVLGATGAVGSIAIQAAKILGAGRVVAAARRTDGLARALELGADATVETDGAGDLADAIKEAAGGAVDVTIDALWGEPAMAAIQASGVFARHIQVGQVAAADITLPAPALRSISLDLRGFSVAHVPIDVLRDARRTLSEHVANGDIVVDLEVLPLARIAEAWERQKESASHPKLVLDPTRA